MVLNLPSAPSPRDLISTQPRCFRPRLYPEFFSNSLLVVQNPQLHASARIQSSLTITSLPMRLSDIISTLRIIEHRLCTRRILVESSAVVAVQTRSPHSSRVWCTAGPVKSFYQRSRASGSCIGWIICMSHPCRLPCLGLLGLSFSTRRLR